MSHPLLAKLPWMPAGSPTPLPRLPRKKIVLGLEVGFALGAKWAIFIPPSLQG